MYRPGSDSKEKGKDEIIEKHDRLYVNLRKHAMKMCTEK